MTTGQFVRGYFDVTRFLAGAANWSVFMMHLLWRQENKALDFNSYDQWAIVGGAWLVGVLFGLTEAIATDAFNGPVIREHLDEGYKEDRYLKTQDQTNCSIAAASGFALLSVATYYVELFCIVATLMARTKYTLDHNYGLHGQSVLPFWMGLVLAGTYIFSGMLFTLFTDTYSGVKQISHSSDETDPQYKKWLRCLLNTPGQIIGFDMLGSAEHWLRHTGKYVALFWTILDFYTEQGSVVWWVVLGCTSAVAIPTLPANGFMTWLFEGEEFAKHAMHEGLSLHDKSRIEEKFRPACLGVRGLKWMRGSIFATQGFLHGVEDAVDVMSSGLNWMLWIGVLPTEMRLFTWDTQEEIVVSAAVLAVVGFVLLGSGMGSHYSEVADAVADCNKVIEAVTEKEERKNREKSTPRKSVSGYAVLSEGVLGRDNNAAAVRAPLVGNEPRHSSSCFGCCA